jgi:Na+/H+ antiporter NhaD/arsenite permease-like protein
MASNHTDTILFRLDRKVLLKFTILLVVAFFIKFLTPRYLGINPQQSVSLAIFLMSVLGTLFFWELRLGVAFMGVSILLLAHVLSLHELTKFASIEIILFLISMMIIVGLLKDAGVFTSFLSYFVRMKNFTARKLIFALGVFAALSSCLVGEVASAILTTALILEICDFYEVNPLPYVVMGVLATNIGSVGTVLGNPIGIIIATKSGLTFEDFLKIAFPLAVVTLVSMMFLFMLFNKKSIGVLNERIKRESDNDFLWRLLNIPMEKDAKTALWVFSFIVLLIMAHHRLEMLMRLEVNTLLIAVPLIAAGLIIVVDKQRAKKIFASEESELWTLFFFILLFAQAGTLTHTGVVKTIATRFFDDLLHIQSWLATIILWASSIISGFLDNVVFVVSMTPVMVSLKDAGIPVTALWWAVLFGGCMGGNFTMIGSTANIVALGILEKKRGDIAVNFIAWIKIGFVITLATMLCAWAWLALLCFLKII